jgi:hypothetical protein
MRATKADFEFSLDDSDGNSFLSVYGYMGQQLYRWPAPDGYPDFAEAWQSTTPMVMRWRLFNWLVEVKDDADQFRLDLLGQTPDHVKSPNKLVDFWSNRILGRSVDEASRQQFVDFMAQGRNPTYDLPLDVDTNIQDRLRSLVALILTSPVFQWRWPVAGSVE